MNEIWKDIEGFEGLYQVSNLGNVRSLDRKVVASDGKVHNYKGKMIKTRINSEGYPVVSLSKKGQKIKSKRVNRLVAMAFIENENMKLEVNHIDGNKENNNVDNLEWCSHSENMIHAFKIGLKSSTEKQKKRAKEGAIKKLSKKVDQLSKEGEFIKQWESMHEADRNLNISYKNISSCCRRKRNIAGGYRWRYSELDEM